MQRPELNPGGVHFFGRADTADFEALEEILRAQDPDGKRIAAVFTEFPSNPLLVCTDLPRYDGLLRCVQEWVYTKAKQHHHTLYVTQVDSSGPRL